MRNLGTMWPAYLATGASLLPLASLVASRRARALPRLTAVFTVLAVETVAMWVVSFTGSNLRLGVPLVPLNLALWIWACIPFLERPIYRHAAYAACAEMLAALPLMAQAPPAQLAVLMPAQAVILAGLGGAVLLAQGCKAMPGCRAVGTFLVTYFGISALAWPVATQLEGEALWWLFTARALVHACAYTRLAWELRVEIAHPVARKAVA